MRRLLILLVFLPVSGASAQVGRDSALWQWTTESKHHHAVVQVSVGNAHGTGVIIRVDRDKPVGSGFEGYCLTAHHVVESDGGRRTITLKYRNGRTAKRCKVVAVNGEFDAALIWVWVPPDIVPAVVSRDSAKAGQKLEYAGLGGGSALRCCLRHFSARASLPTNRHQIFADAPLLPGDSGGPVFNERQEVVGVISGGWFWWDGGIKASGVPIKVTWPARACNTSVIHKLLKAAGPSRGQQIVRKSAVSPQRTPDAN